ncbi:ABC transporter permease [Aliikangiella sp. IMCC44653]
MFNYYLKLSWLSMKRTPMLTLLMIFAIGLGIGGSMTVLTVDYLMSQDPIPEKSQQLFHVQLDSYNLGNTANSPDGLPSQLTYQDAVNLLSSSIPTKHTPLLRTGFAVIDEREGKAPFLESARAANSDFFAMMNAPFLFGSAWASEVDQNPRKLVVIGERLNDTLFNGKNSVGQKINLNKQYYTIVGVLKHWELTPRFYDVNNHPFAETEQIYLPFSLLPVIEAKSWGNNNAWKVEDVSTYAKKLRSETFWIQFWVQLDTQRQQQEYRDYLASYIEQQRALGRFEKPDARSDIKDVNQWMTRNLVVSDDNRVLVGLSFMFLAVCMINTLGLLLAKFLKRSAEIGVRRALGASRVQIFIQHLVDVGLIGAAGGILGLLIGQAGLYGVKSLYSNYERLVSMDITLILMAISIALGASLIAGLYPAWLICRTNPSVYLKTQ